jgi:hypothetical protein
MNPLKARYECDGMLAVAGLRSVERFSGMWAGVTAPGESPGYFLVVGERSDGLFHCLWEKEARLAELRKTVSRTCSAMLVDCLWLNSREDPDIATFRMALMGTEDEKGSPPPVIAGVPERFRAGFASGLETVREMMREGRLLVFEALCPRLLYEIRRPRAELMTSNVIQTLVLTVGVLEYLRMGCDPGPPEQPWYGNRSFL